MSNQIANPHVMDTYYVVQQRELFALESVVDLGE